MWNTGRFAWLFLTTLMWLMPQTAQAQRYAFLRDVDPWGVNEGGNLAAAAGVPYDMIGSGTTLCRATQACLEAGASRVSVGATHGLFENGAPKLFEQDGIDSITVTDTVAIGNLGLPDAHVGRITVIGAAALFADQLREMSASSGSR